MGVNHFYPCWFKGFEKGLEDLDAGSRENLLKECAKACSESYSLQIYQEAYKNSDSLESFMKNLKDKFSELSYQLSSDQKIVTFIYDHCACDLFTDGYINSGLLCECSRYSLLHNWEAIMGEGSVEVILRQSILRGQSNCIFDVTLK